MTREEKAAAELRLQELEREHLARQTQLHLEAEERAKVGRNVRWKNTTDNGGIEELSILCSILLLDCNHSNSMDF